MNFIKISEKIDRLNEVIAKSVALLSILVVSITFLVASLRYVFNIGFVFMQESIIYLHAIVFLICAAYGLKAGFHVKIDIIYNHLTKRQQKKLNILGTIFLLFPSMIFTFIVCLPYVLSSWKYLENSKDPGGLDFVYFLKTNLLIAPLLIILQGLSELIKDFSYLKKKSK